MKKRMLAGQKLSLLGGWILLALLPVTLARSQTLPIGSQVIYDDALENGWQNYGWATLNYANASPVHGSGGASIRVDAGAYQALYLHHAASAPTSYTSLTFWIHGGTAGGQTLQLQATLDGNALAAVPVPAPLANTWQQVTVSLSSPRCAGSVQLRRLLDSEHRRRDAADLLRGRYRPRGQPAARRHRRAGERGQRRPAGGRAHLRGEHRHLGRPTGHRREPGVARGNRRGVIALSPAAVRRTITTGSSTAASRTTPSNGPARSRPLPRWRRNSARNPTSRSITAAARPSRRQPGWPMPTAARRTRSRWAPTPRAATGRRSATGPPCAPPPRWRPTTATISCAWRTPPRSPSGIGRWATSATAVGRPTSTAARSPVRRKTPTPTRRTSPCSARKCWPSTPRSTSERSSSAGRIAMATGSTP